MTEVTTTDRGGESISCVQVESDYKIPKYIPDIEALGNVWKALPDFKCREDDVLLCSYPKTGTNWLYEVSGMILQKKAERLTTGKIHSNLEALPAEPIDALPSPRVLNTHIRYRYLPRGVKEKQMKTVLVLRNPKDTAVSYYNHMVNLKPYDYSGKWENWLPVYVEGELEFGTYERYLSEWEKMAEDPGFPLYIVYYEDMKEDGPKEIQKLAKFLGIDINEQLCSEINRMCDFDLMRQEKMPEEMKKLIMKENKDFFRKGQIGDWKNWFTVAQNEMFDSLWNERMKESKLTFKYAPST